MGPRSRKFIGPVKCLLRNLKIRRQFPDNIFWQPFLIVKYL
jgi:hypothetical protein